MRSSSLKSQVSGLRSPHFHPCPPCPPWFTPLWLCWFSTADEHRLSQMLRGLRGLLDLCASECIRGSTPSGLRSFLTTDKLRFAQMLRRLILASPIRVHLSLSVVPLLFGLAVSFTADEPRFTRMLRSLPNGLNLSPSVFIRGSTSSGLCRFFNHGCQ